MRKMKLSEEVIILNLFQNLIPMNYVEAEPSRYQIGFATQTSFFSIQRVGELNHIFSSAKAEREGGLKQQEQ